MVKTLLPLLLLFTISLFSQQDLATRFNLALNYYDTQQYPKALEAFQNLADISAESDFSTAAYLFTGKTLHKLGKYAESREVFVDFIKRFPGSRYIEDAQLSLANTLLISEQYYDAVKELLLLARTTKDTYYYDEALRAVHDISLNHLSTGIISELYDLYSFTEADKQMRLITAKAYIREGDHTRAAQVLSAIINPDAELKPEIDSLLALLPGLTAGQDNQILVAVLIPQSGDGLNSESLTAAREILEGIKFAFSEHNSANPDKIGLIIKDTRNNAETIRSIREQLQSNPAIKAIIGPIFSSEVSTAAREFNGRNIPIISPTATENELTLLNPYFFQANPPFGIRGTIIAQYIYYVENKRKMALLNSIDGYSPLLAAVFKEEFEKLGGQIISGQTYKSGTFNLGTPITQIASVAAEIEGIYLPLADRTDAPMILSRLLQANINVILYGNQDWMNATGFEASSELSNKLTFTSDHFIDFDDPGYQQFSRNFLNKTKISAGRNPLYGYDTAQYLLEIIKKGNRERESIKSAMESGITVPGFHNNISFDERRINTFLNIIRYRNGKFELIDKFKGSN